MTGGVGSLVRRFPPAPAEVCEFRAELLVVLHEGRSLGELLNDHQITVGRVVSVTPGKQSDLLQLGYIIRTCAVPRGDAESSGSRYRRRRLARLQVQHQPDVGE